MQLLPEPGRPDRSRPGELTPCDKAALSCASRLRRQNPSVHLTAVLVAAPSVCPDAAAVSILKNALALGADRGILVKSPAVIPGPDFGRVLLRALVQYAGIHFSMILTGFHMRPAVTAASAAEQGYGWCGNVADLSLVRGGASVLSEAGQPVQVDVLFKQGGQVYSQKQSLPLLTEIVRSDIPPSQPTFLEIAAANKMSVESVDLEISATAGAVSSESVRFPLFFDTKKTAPEQIASELLSILRNYCLIPRDAAGHDDVFSRPEISRHPEKASDSSVNPLLWADRIISVGRGAASAGISTEQVIAQARCLASLLDAYVGSSKAAVDLGLMPPFCQVGKTSSIVNPDLYIACGYPVRSSIRTA